MSPILTRPVREQFEHDRIIRLLQGRYRRKFEAAANPGAEQNASVSVGTQTMFPDLVLFSQERGRRLEGTVEVETGESVNTLEAMSQWALFSRLRAPFVLYVPPSAVDTARRLCAEYQIPVSEIWTYHTALDQVRFTMVHRAPTPAAPKTRTAASAEGKAVKAAKTAVKASAKVPGKVPIKAKVKAKTKVKAKAVSAAARKRPAAAKRAVPAKARKAARPAKRR